MHAHQRPKLETYEDLIFAVVKTVHYDDQLPGGTAEVVETGEVMVFVGGNFVITVRHGEHGGLQRVRKELEADPDLLALGPSAVLHAVLDSIVDSYVTVCRALQEDIDETETAVFTASNRLTDSNVIYILKREVLELRRATAPLVPVVRHLSRGRFDQIETNVRDYFRDVDDHLSEVVDRVNGFDDLLTTLVTANLARVSVVQNEDMRKISAWVAIAAVPTMLAGIYGMNFKHMPELNWSFGYPLVLLVMATLLRSALPRVQTQRVAVALSSSTAESRASSSRSTALCRPSFAQCRGTVHPAPGELVRSRRQHLQHRHGAEGRLDRRDRARRDQPAGAPRAGGQRTAEIDRHVGCVDHAFDRGRSGEDRQLSPHVGVLISPVAKVQHQLGPRTVGGLYLSGRRGHRVPGHAQRQVGPLVRDGFEPQHLDRFDADERHRRPQRRRAEVLLQCSVDGIERRGEGHAHSR